MCSERSSVSLTSRFVHFCNRINGRPAVGSCDAWVRAAFIHRGEHIAMFFALGAPGGRKLMENPVVRETETIEVRSIYSSVEKIYRLRILERLDFI